MKIIPWRHHQPVTTFHNDLEDWVRELFDTGGPSRLPEAFQQGPLPPINLADAEKEFIVTVELPGLDEKDIEIQLLSDQLIISGERKWEEETKDKEFYRVESQYGSFRRAVRLPEGLNTDPEAIAASYKRGMLEVHVPKVAPKPAAKIEVKKG